MIKLERPLVIFDLETTGLEISNARIIQLSYIKVQPDGTSNRQAYFVNPEQLIPQEVVELTNITQAMVANAPTFRQLAPILAEEFKDCDFAGYNSNRFDIPMLAEEFLRAGIEFDFNSAKLIDAMAIFMSMEKRTLAAAYKFYCNREMEDDFQAHRADEDTEATWRVLQAQVEHYGWSGELSELEELSKRGDNVDFAGRFVRNEQGHIIFNFGKHKGLLVEDVIRREPSYYSWMMQGDFAMNTKLVLTKIKNGQLK